jgi:nucleoside-diphosphate-sugar epimerase
MKRVLVTGASGFVGSNLARRLIRDGYATHLLVSPLSDQWRLEELKDHAQVHAVDLANAEALERIVGAIKPEWVFHLAAHGAYSWQLESERMIATNVVGTINLVRAIRRADFEVMVNAGSSSEYGFVDHAPMEDEACDPNSDYAVTKVSGTLYCRSVACRCNLHIVTLRLYSVYGPWEEPNRLMPMLVVRGLQGELPPLVSPHVARDYVYIDDVVHAFLLAAAHRTSELGAIFNVGTGTQTSVAQAVAAARTILGISQDPVWGSMPNRAWDTNTWVSDSRKIAHRLGWLPRHSLDSGLREMVGWFRDRPALERWYCDRQAKIAGAIGHRITKPAGALSS